MLDQGLNTKTTSIEKVMTANPKTISPHILAVEALNMMDKSKITALMVVDKSGTPIGALNMHDLLRAGVM